MFDKKVSYNVDQRSDTTAYYRSFSTGASMASNNGSVPRQFSVRLVKDVQ